MNKKHRNSKEENLDISRLYSFSLLFSFFSYILKLFALFSFLFCFVLLCFSSITFQILLSRSCNNCIIISARMNNKNKDKDTKEALTWVFQQTRLCLRLWKLVVCIYNRRLSSSEHRQTKNERHLYINISIISFV